LEGAVSNNQLSRVALLSWGAKGGVAALAAGSGLGLLAESALAETLPDGDLAYLRLLISTELLGADFYTNAVAAEPYDGLPALQLKLALANENEHYTILSAIFTGAGQAPATADDIDFTYPEGTFETTVAVTKAAVGLEGLFLGTYLGAVGGVQSRSLYQPLARIAACQAQHFSAFSERLGRAGFQAYPAPIPIDVATQALAAYTS
jgi:hypothetical protein